MLQKLCLMIPFLLVLQILPHIQSLMMWKLCFLHDDSKQLQILELIHCPWFSRTWCFLFRMIPFSMSLWVRILSKEYWNLKFAWLQFLVFRLKIFLWYPILWQAPCYVNLYQQKPNIFHHKKMPNISEYLQA